LVTDGLCPESLSAADFDLDGDRDLAVALSALDIVQLLENNGQGTFSTVPNDETHCASFPPCFQ
jgi:hypothetical protein